MKCSVDTRGLWRQFVFVPNSGSCTDLTECLVADCVVGNAAVFCL